MKNLIDIMDGDEELMKFFETYKIFKLEDIYNILEENKEWKINSSKDINNINVLGSSSNGSKGVGNNNRSILNNSNNGMKNNILINKNEDEKNKFNSSNCQTFKSVKT